MLFKESSSTKTPELTNQEIYENAQTLMESGNYLEAADLFATISDFKNSANLREEIFNRYDGYYLSNDESVSFYINIQNAETADIILEKSVSGKLVRLEESSVLNDHTISASFTDSQNNVGKLNIELKDESIHLSTTVEQKNDELSIGNQDLTFQLVNKSDRPIEKKHYVRHTHTVGNKQNISGQFKSGRLSSRIQQNDVSRRRNQRTPCCISN